MIHCFIADCSPLEDISLYNRAYALLSEDRRRKADFYRFGKDKRLSAVAGLFLRLVEGSYGKFRRMTTENRMRKESSSIFLIQDVMLSSLCRNFRSGYISSKSEITWISPKRS